MPSRMRAFSGAGVRRKTGSSGRKTRARMRLEGQHQRRDAARRGDLQRPVQHRTDGRDARRRNCRWRSRRPRDGRAVRLAFSLRWKTVIGVVRPSGHCEPRHPPFRRGACSLQESRECRLVGLSRRSCIPAHGCRRRYRAGRGRRPARRAHRSACRRRWRARGDRSSIAAHVRALPQRRVVDRLVRLAGNAGLAAEVFVEGWRWRRRRGSAGGRARRRDRDWRR